MSRPKPIHNAQPEQVFIESLDTEGRGIARVEGKVLFVDGALPGERVWARRTQAHKSFDRAELLQVVKASSLRVSPPCPHFGVCGGCSLQHLEPAAQVAIKQRQLEDHLWRIGKVRPERVLPPIHGPSLGYRSKARLSVRTPKTRGAMVGFRERNSSYVVDMGQCLTLDPRVGQRILPLRTLIGQMQSPQDFPQIEVAATPDAVALVFRHMRPLAESDLQHLRAFGVQHDLQIWLQPRGPETLYPLWPEQPEPLHYDLPDYSLRLRFDPLVFTQVNQAANQVMVRRAMALLQPQPGEHILDLFCGLGNFTLPIARLGAQVLGIEGDARLVALAAENAAANGLADQARYAVADLTQAQMEDFAPAGAIDKMLIDPPRSGAIEVLRSLTPGVRRLVYVSCNPATLARDAEYLVHERGYRLRAAGVVNMFPHTAHVESIALFER
ncbi:MULTISPECIES: 23S rRNA (uracil(1939)-C(5))-methyltransferase RlmD [Acidithiobacillus]|uniref:23S rRNA (Uracil(1939)-C(5))-methyltransferase RlmD n=1 Tax=Acidithiobacillus ferruginosus TaxID=3063951 RepID=A0ACD5IIP2_9PROT|nr:23S rRNA (uracil(1939)-C(5))-methyltransferase RlmD [Acidithiobacillus ferruginosus]MBU2814551.1 23S rRNA (uracil(1939)-C(5))-methyltransferase RlmD [Acidithiobacillus ferruginosus]